MSDLFDPVGCPVCGHLPNPWCAANHLPYAEETLAVERAKLDGQAKRIEAYRNAVGTTSAEAGNAG